LARCAKPRKVSQDLAAAAEEPAKKPTKTFSSWLQRIRFREYEILLPSWRQQCSLRAQVVYFLLQRVSKMSVLRHCGSLSRREYN
jgi:hypothetical protein